MQGRESILSHRMIIRFFHLSFFKIWFTDETRFLYPLTLRNSFVIFDQNILYLEVLKIQASWE